MFEVKMRGDLWHRGELKMQDATVSGEYEAYLDACAGFAAWAVLRTLTGEQVGYEVRNARLEVRRAESFGWGEHDAAPYDASEYECIIDTLNDRLGEDWLLSIPSATATQKLADMLNKTLAQWAYEEGVSIEAWRGVGDPILVIPLTKYRVSDEETRWRISDEDQKRLDALI